MSQSLEYGEFERSFDRVHAKGVVKRYSTEVSQRRIQMASGTSVLQELVVIPEDVQSLMSENDLYTVSRFYTVAEKAIPSPKITTMSESYISMR